MDYSKIDAGAITRLVLLVLSLINMAMTLSGHPPFDFDEAGITNFIALAFSGLVSIYAYWKNNNITPEAKQAQAVMKQLKKKRAKEVVVIESTGSPLLIKDEVKNIGGNI